jgi:hypothetical protein
VEYEYERNYFHVISTGFSSSCIIMPDYMLGYLIVIQQFHVLFSF